MNRIRELRKEKGMSQVSLSTAVEVAQVTVSQYECGRSYPSVKALLKMAEIFDVSVDYLLGLSDIRGILKSGITTDDEAELLNNYRSLTPSDRALVRAYMQALCDHKGK